MRIAIVHYHLGHGGVPQTIRSHSHSLTRLGIPHVILIGSHLPEDSSLPISLLPALEYAGRAPATACAKSLSDDLLMAASRHLGSPPDLWHIHNHSLGKNLALTQAVSLLAQRGEHLLLHIHDLAEDGRPALYAAIRHLDSIYPFCPRIHYAFLNPRDRLGFGHSRPPENRLCLDVVNFVFVVVVQIRHLDRIPVTGRDHMHLRSAVL